MTYHIAKAAAFISQRNQTSAQYQVFITPYTAAQYASMGATCYLSNDQRSGYALTAEYDLISVFSLTGANQGPDAMASAIENGAATLDCIGEFLVQYYAGYGFKEYKRIQWDDAYAPKNWDYDQFKRPDIIYMKR